MGVPEEMAGLSPAKAAPPFPLGQICQLLSRRHGWDLSRYDAAFLEKSLAKRQSATLLASGPAYLQRLLEDRSEAEALFDSLHITHSEFFRNPLTFALLEQVLLPNLLSGVDKSGRSEIRVWSAGCAAGQEACSVAILLEELTASRGLPLRFRIIATDVSETALALAREGAYDQSAVQNVRLKHLRNHFSRQGEAYVVAPRLRDRVDFSTYDLLDDRSGCPPASLYGDFDLIFCTNVLFYYRPDIRQLILDKVCRALSPGGYFVTGEAERDIVAKQDCLRPVAPPSPIFQKRGKSAEKY